MEAAVQTETRSYVTTVTPELATILLAKNTNNRPVEKRTVEAYAAAMKRGEWKMNGEAIKIAKSGRLLDGQHRLLAIVASDCAVPSCVTEGLEDDSFDTIDIGRTRKASDILAMAGESNATRLAAAARTVLMLQGRDVKRKVTPVQCRMLLEEMPQLRYWVSRYQGMKTLKALIPSSIAGIAALFANRYGSEKVEQFLERVNSGIGLDRGDPALVLRERFIDRTHGKTFSSEVIMAYIIKAMNAHVTGKRISILRMSADEKFPEIV